MENIKKQYAQVILHSALNIQEGESLSINTNPSLYDFAYNLGMQASEITLQQVNLVVIDNGIPQDVIAITPELNEQLITPPSAYAMLRLDDTEDRDWSIQENPQEIIESMALLQKAGLLGAPPLNRQVAPWALMAVPGPIWAQQLLGEGADERELWQIFALVLKLDDKNPVSAWKEQAGLIAHRIAVLNELDIDDLHIQNSHTDLRVRMVKDSHWRGGRQTLANGRSFIPMLPLERVSALPERSSVCGTVKASKPIRLFGSVVEQAVFTFTDGKLTDYDAKKGRDLLELLFSVDDGASRLGELSLVDEGSPLSNFGHHFGHAGFDDNFCSCITFGVCDSLHLDDGSGYEDAMDLQQRTGCNVSDIHLAVKIGTLDTRVTATLKNGKSKVIMEKGQFII